MESTNRLPAQPRPGHAPLEDLHRIAWETLRDLGLTEEEIAAYFGGNLDRVKSLAGFDTGRPASRH